MEGSLLVDPTLMDKILRLCLLFQELGIKHSLHRKKLQLALQALGSEEETNYGKLDFNWVTSKRPLCMKKNKHCHIFSLTVRQVHSLITALAFLL